MKDSSYNDRSFAPAWLTMDIGIDFEYMKKVSTLLSDFSQDLPDDKYGSNIKTSFELSVEDSKIITEFMANERLL